MADKRKYYAKTNLHKRIERRRGESSMAREERTLFKYPPSCDELMSALEECRKTTTGILRLAAMMDNIDANYSRRYADTTGEKPGMTYGVRQFLSEACPGLMPRYKTLMRYSVLAKKIRRAAGLMEEDCYNLLWGLKGCQGEDLQFHEAVVSRLRSLYDSLEGMNFKAISQKLSETYRVRP